MRPAVGVRGIYTTALTVLFLGDNWRIARPSPLIQERFGLNENDDDPSLSIEDREDKQGIILSGIAETAAQSVTFLLDLLPEALILGKPHPGKLHAGRVHYLLEFPNPAKSRLDSYRSQKVFTMPGHHYFKVIDPQSVDEAEKAAPSGDAEKMREELMTRLVVPGYRPSREIQVRHQKVGYGGFTFSGSIQNFSRSEGIVLNRRFKGGGAYDSLNLPKEKGDFGTVEIPPDLWWFRRRYHAADGQLKGEIYNINTPVELYPDLIYYVDLELDVVRWPDGRVKIVDQEILRDKREKGFITAHLARRAEEEAERLAEHIKGMPVSR